MAKGKYRVSFADDTFDDVEAESRDAAKTAAKNNRLNQLDPARKMSAPDRNSHNAVRVVAVAEHGVDHIDDENDEHKGARRGRGVSNRDKAIGVLAFVVLGLASLLDYLHPMTAREISHAGVMQVIGASGTAIGATIAALAAVTGDSLVMPFFNESKKAWMLQLWSDVQVAGTLRVRSGKWHDDVQGIRIKTVVSDLQPLLPAGTRQPLYSGDTLHVDLGGSAVAGDVEYVVMLMWFEELSAQAASLITYEQFKAREGNYITGENTIATGTTPAWTGAEAINADIDQFHARSNYAITGYLVDTEVSAVAWQGNDTANVRNGGPGTETEREITAQWFVELARKTGLPCIPVINADNKAATTVSTLQDENGADTVLDTIFCELRSA
jgi:hypothetical protein